MSSLIFLLTCISKLLIVYLGKGVYVDSVKELRQITGLSQSQFAKKYHINKYTLQEWEQNRVQTPEYARYLLSRVIKELDCKK